MNKTKTLLLASIILLSIIWVSFAQEVRDDCAIAEIKEDELISQIRWDATDDNDISNIYEVFDFPNDITVAQRHLRWYCCKEKILRYESNSCRNLPQQFPESLYLFAHLVDIGFRKVDWDPMDIYWSVELDPDGKQRRRDIRSVTEEAEWEQASEIIQMFQDDWQIDNEKGTWIANKYQKVCDEALRTVWRIFNVYNMNQQNADTTMMDKCKRLVSKRKSEELKYIWSMMVHKSSKYLIDNLKAYTKDYFIENRWVNLLEKIWTMVQRFETVNQQVHNWVDDCSVK